MTASRAARCRVARVLVALWTVLVAVAAGAQQLSVVEFVHDPVETMAAKFPKQDFNGEMCALVRVGLTVQEVVFEGDIVSAEYRDGEWWVYMESGSNWITVKAARYLPLRYDFPFKVVGLNTYNMTIDREQAQDALPIVHLSTNALDAKIVLDDGREYATDNSVFNIQIEPGTYAYTLSSGTEGFVPTGGHFVVPDSTLFVDLGLVPMRNSTTHRMTIIADRFAHVSVDGVLVKNKGRTTIEVPAGKHVVRATAGEQRWVRERTKYVSQHNDTVEVSLMGSLKVESPREASFSIKPLQGAVKPSKSKFAVGEEVRLLGAYDITCKKKGYEPMVYRVAVGVGEEKRHLRIPVVAKVEGTVAGTAVPTTSRTWRKYMGELKRMADGGDDLAMNRYAERLYPDKPAEAMAYWRKAAQLGNTDAMLSLGQHGNGQAEKRKYQLMAYSHGCDTLAYAIAMSYTVEYSQGNRHMADSVSQWHHTTYAQGDMRSLPFLGDIYYEGIGSGRDYGQARHYYEQSLKHVPTNLHVRERLIDMQYYGFDAEKDEAAAMQQYEELRSEEGYFSAGMASKMARYYCQNKDYEELADCLDAAGSLGSLGLSETDLVGAADQCYQEGQYGCAARLYASVLRIGSKDNVKANYRLGEMYMFGKGQAADLAMAEAYLAKASRAGSPVGACLLGDCLFMQQKYSQAADAYATAAQRDYAPACGKLGTLYGRGLGVNKDYRMAENLWIQAARAGHSPSMQNLVTYYQKVKKDTTNADYWIRQLKSAPRSEE